MDDNKAKYRKGKNPNSLRNLKPLKKGDPSPNKIGARAHDIVAKEMRKFTNKYLIEVIELAVMGNITGLQAILTNPNSPAIQVGIARSLFKAISDGDWDTLEKIISRIIGKIPDNLNINSVVKTELPLLDKETIKRILDKIESDV